MEMQDRVRTGDEKFHIFIDNTVKEISRAYLNDQMPWVVGFSGGKDSTAVLQLVFRSLAQLPKKKVQKPVHVVCSDTLVEAPYVVGYIDRVLADIERGAKKLGLPITVNKVVPELEDTFFVNLIGKGYPSPNRWFRWCTERLKIKPTTKFIQNQIDERGSVVILLGSRKAESSSRAQVLANYEIKNSVFRKHASLTNAYVYAPIVDWTTDDVWDFLATYPSSWGGSNWELIKLYKDASGGECPLVIDTTTPSCGQSRFGCWVCTVVDADKSMEGFIDSGLIHLQPLLDLRNWLKEIRDDVSKRDDVRRNSTPGLGPFKYEVRHEILKRLFEVSKETGLELIRQEELDLIQSYWTQDGDSSGMAVKLYNEYFGGDSTMIGENNHKNQLQEVELLQQFCQKHSVNAPDIQSLVEIERQMIGKQKRRNLHNKIDEVIKRVALREEG